MNTRFKKNAKVFDIMVTVVSGTLSVAVMLYAVYYFGLCSPRYGYAPPSATGSWPAS